jgi:8-oxo-dGTP diphosphatase
MEKKYPRAGVGVMVVRDNKVLLGRRHDDAEKADSELHGEGTWTMPGGKLEWHKTFAQGATDELTEETSLIPKNLKIISVTDEIIPDKHFVTAGFLCTEFEGEPQVMEPDEIIKWEWFAFSELPKNIFPASLKIIKNFFANEIYKH